MLRSITGARRWNVFKFKPRFLASNFKPDVVSGQPIDDKMLSQIRSLGAKKKWLDIYELINKVSLNELVQKCKVNVYKGHESHGSKVTDIHQQRRSVPSTTAKNYDTNAEKTDMMKHIGPPRMDNVFTDIIEAHILSADVRVWDILQHTYDSPLLAATVGPRRLLRICNSHFKAQSQVDEKLLQVFALWIVSAQTFDARRTLLQGLLRLVSEGENVDRKKGYDLSVQLMAQIRRTVDAEVASRKTSSSRRTSPDPYIVLGDTALLCFNFWCKLNLVGGAGSKLGRNLFKECVESPVPLLASPWLRSELFCLCVKGALGKITHPMHAGSTSTATVKSPSAARPGVPESDSATSTRAQSPDTTPATGDESQLSNWQQWYMERDMVGLEALLGLCSDNSLHSIILRSKFFSVLVADRGHEKLIVYLSKRLLKESDKQPEDKKLLFGTNVWNAIIVAHASIGHRAECFQVLDAMNAERLRPTAVRAFNLAQQSLLDSRDLVSFGPNVYSYIEVANSSRAATLEIKAKRKSQWPHTMARLFSRMAADQVIPDMRFLFNMAEAAREIKDFDLVTKVIEKAHLIAQVPRRRLSVLETGESSKSIESFAWQPRTSMPQEHSRISAADSRSTDRSVSTFMAGSVAPRQYIPTLDEFGQIYHYGIAIAFNCRRPEDCLMLLMMMISMDLKPGGHTMYYVLRCLVDADSPTHFEEVVRLFGLMPKWGVKRDELHACCFIESLAKLGRVGDAYQGLTHMHSSNKTLNPITYSVVVESLLRAMEVEAPKKSTGQLNSLLGSGKKQLTEQEAAEAAAAMIVHTATLFFRKNKSRDFTKDFVLGSGFRGVCKSFYYFSKRAHPDIVQRVRDEMIVLDRSLAEELETHFFRKPDRPPAISERASG